MIFLILIILVCVGACDDATEDQPNQTDTTATSTPDTTLDSADTVPTAEDIADAPDSPDVSPAALPDGVSVRLLVPNTISTTDQIPLMVRLWLDAEDRTYQGYAGDFLLTVARDGQNVSGEWPRVVMRRGVGSVTLPPQMAGALVVGVWLNATDSAPIAEARLQIEEAPNARIFDGGTLNSAEDLRWEADERIEVRGSLVVAEGQTLTIEAGVQVRLDFNVNIDVQGDLIAEGTPQDPVVFVPINAEAAWGGIFHTGNGTYTSALFVGGGNDTSRVFGHSGSQPILFAAAGASLSLDGCALQDSPGKGVGSDSALAVHLLDTLITRTDSGAEIVDTPLTMRGCHLLDFPTLPPAPPDADDNDALYLMARAPFDPSIQSVLTDTVISHGADDGFDHNGATVRAERLWIDTFAHECIAASSGGTITVSDSLLQHCDQGLEAGYGAPQVEADHLLILNNGTGVRFGDSYDWADEGRLTVRDSVIAASARENFLNHRLGPQGPAPAEWINLHHCLLDDASYSTAPETFNIQAIPELGPDWRLKPKTAGTNAASDGGDAGLISARDP